jgi:hypothetical protein
MRGHDKWQRMAPPHIKTPFSMGRRKSIVCPTGPPA